MLRIFETELKLHHTVSKLKFSMVVPSSASLSPPIVRELILKEPSVEHLQSLLVSASQKFDVDVLPKILGLSLFLCRQTNLLLFVALAERTSRLDFKPVLETVPVECV